MLSANLNESLAALAAKKLLGLLASRVPFVAVGPIGWILGWCITKVIHAAIEYTFLNAAVNEMVKSVNDKLDKVHAVFDEIQSTDKKDLNEKKANELNAKLSAAYRGIIVIE